MNASKTEARSLTCTAKQRSRRFFLSDRSMVSSVLIVALSLGSGLILERPVLAQDQGTSQPDFSLTLTGDSIIMSPATIHKDEPAFAGLLKTIRQGDAAFTNLEEVYAGPTAYPAATSGNTWLQANPEMLKELQWMGFNLFGAANNHAFDYGIQGILDTIQVLERNNAVYAGIGETLGKARAAGYLSTSHGRIALISCTSTFLDSAPAGDPRPGVQGRPGINPLHHQTIYNLDSTSFDAIRKIREDLGIRGGGGRGGQQPSSQDVVSFPTYADPYSKLSPLSFKRSDKTATVTTADPTDLTAIGDSIKDAREQVDYVLTSIHSHEGGGGPDPTPAQFLIEFAHAAVDAGTDVFVSHGPHVLRGIEIYKGKVILYSLGNLWFQDNFTPQPSDFYNRYGLGPNALPSQGFDARGMDSRENTPVSQSVVARVMFHDGRPAEVILTPIWITGKPRRSEGIPGLANPTMAKQILEHLQKLSQPFGTNIVIKDGVGHITISDSH